MRISTIFMLFCFLASGCNYQRQQKLLQAKEDSLEQRARELSVKERELALREASLLQKELAMDSVAKIDTAQPNVPAVAGAWNVEMTCTETTCAGSAVGDTKTETWEINYQGTEIIAQATANNQLVRVYTGTYRDGAIYLMEEQASATLPLLAKMVVRLKPAGDGRMEGEREIIRENNCRIVYALQLNAAKK